MKKGTKLKDLIAKKGISIEEFAAKIDVSVSSVFKYYNKENFDSDLLERFCSVLEVPITYFFDDKFVFNDNSAVVTGNGNSVIAGQNNKLEVCKQELDDTLIEIKRLKQNIESQDRLLQEKNKIIDMMMSLSSKPHDTNIEVFSTEGAKCINILNIENIIPNTGKEVEFVNRINSGVGNEFPCCTIIVDGVKVFVMQDSAYIWKLITKTLSSLFR